MYHRHASQMSPIAGLILLAAQMAAAQTSEFSQALRFGLPGSVDDTFYLGTVIAADIGSLDGPPDGG